MIGGDDGRWDGLIVEGIISVRVTGYKLYIFFVKGILNVTE